MPRMRDLGYARNREGVTKILAETGMSINDMAQGSGSITKFYQDRHFRNEYFNRLAEGYFKDDRRGNALQGALNQYYSQGDFESIERIADVLAEQLRAHHEGGSRSQARNQLLEISKQKPPQLGQPGGSDVQGKVGDVVTGFQRGRRRGVNYQTAVRAGETGGISGRQRSTRRGILDVDAQNQNQLGAQQVTLGAA